MVALASLWLPILVAAVFVFLASAVIHMILRYHRSDYGRVPSEDAVMDALRSFSIPAGDYMVPCPGTHAEARTPEFQAKMKKGPVVFMTLRPRGSTAMGGRLLQWFVFCIVVSLFAAYLASRALAAGTPYSEVFRFTGTVAFVGYALAQWENSIWYDRAWRTTIKTTIDGLVYGLLTGGVFGWLWP